MGLRKGMLIALYELLVWPHEVEPWFSWYRGRVETLDANSYLVFELLVWSHEVEPWFHSWYRGRVETLDAKYNFNSTLSLHQQFKGKNEISFWGEFYFTLILIFTG